MRYQVEFTDIAIEDLKNIRNNEPMTYKKILRLIDELFEHPMTGTGKPERLKGNRTGQWSRRITTKHRLIYTIENRHLIVLVLSSSSHYGD